MHAAPFRAPASAASLAAAQTGEAIAVEMPRRVLHPVPMRGGSTEYVLSLGYADPAIRAAQRSVQDRQAIQGPGGRPRGPNRAADDPVTLIYTGRKPLPGVPVDVLIRSWGAHAPPRFVRAVADAAPNHPCLLARSTERKLFRKLISKRDDGILLGDDPLPSREEAIADARVLYRRMKCERERYLTCRQEAARPTVTAGSLVV